VILLNLQLVSITAALLIILHLILSVICKKMKKQAQGDADNDFDSLHIAAVIAMALGFSTTGILSLCFAADYSVHTAPFLANSDTATTLNNVLDYYSPWWLRTWLGVISMISIVILGIKSEGIVAGKKYSPQQCCNNIITLCRCNSLCLGFSLLMVDMIRNIIAYRARSYFYLDVQQIFLQIIDIDLLALWLALAMLIPGTLFAVQFIHRWRTDKKQRRRINI
jgi:hypothetical protein